MRVGLTIKKGMIIMLSFGQRLKLIRKEAQITQAELSEKLMVSVQAVSKWECDNSMPDISQIVPLAAILGVTTDCLLGVGGDEKADREKLYREIEAIYDNSEYTYEEIDKNPEGKCLVLYREHIKKYPLDYQTKFKCAECIYCFLYDARKYSFELEDSLYNEAVSLLNGIINYDRDTTRLLDAKSLLIKLYVHKEDFTKAEEVAEGLPHLGNIRAIAEIEIYSKKDDQEKCLAISKKMCANAVNDYLWALWTRARRISIFGTDRKKEAIHAWRDLLESAKFNYNRFDDVDIHSEFWWYRALNHIANEYIAISEFDKTFETIEELTDALCTNYEELKEKGDAEGAWAIKNSAAEHLQRCYSWCFSTDDNIIANDARFKKCKERLAALE